MKLTQKVKVQHSLGIHSRPAAAIVKLLQPCKSEVSFICKGETINAKSIMSILMLALRKGDQVTIIVEGSDAQVTMDKLLHAFERPSE
jgi:phosphocarrier protein